MELLRLLLVAASSFPYDAHASPAITRDLGSLDPQSSHGCAPKTPFPSDEICGKRGNLNPGLIPSQYLSDNQTLSLQTCRDWCHDVNAPAPQNKHCFGFAHNSTDNACVFYAYDLNGPVISFVEDPNSDVIFYSLDCYNCRTSCAVTGNNLLNNGGFDVSNQFIGPWKKDSIVSQAPPTIVSPGHNSKNAIAPLNGDEFVFPQGICPAVDYLLSIDVMLVPTSPTPPDPGNGQAGFNFFQVLMGDCEYSHSFSPGNDTTFPPNIWRTIQFSLRRFVPPGSIPHTPDLLELQASLVSANYQGYVDSAKVIRIPPVTPLIGTGKSLLLNGDFENGKFSPWNATGFGIRPKYSVVSPGLPGKSGTKSSGKKFKFTVTAKHLYPTYSYYKNGGLTFEQLTTKPTSFRKQYVLTMQYEMFNMTEVQVAVNNDYIFTTQESLPGSGRVLPPENRVYSRIFTGSGKRDRITITFTSDTKGNKDARLMVYLDNISVFELGS